MVKSKIKTLFFDAAGTLIFPSEPVGRSYAAVARKHGLESDPEIFHQAFKSAWKRFPRRNVADTSRDDKDWWRSFAVAVLNDVRPERNGFDDHAWFEDLYEHFALPGAWGVFPDVFPVLEALRANHRMAVVSNFDRRLYRILENTDLLRHFDHVIISSEAGSEKPDPEIFRIALEKTKSSPQETLHVGDDPLFDLEGAKNAGLSAFHLNRPQVTLSDLLPRLA